MEKRRKRDSFDSGDPVKGTGGEVRTDGASPPLLYLPPPRNKGTLPRYARRFATRSAEVKRCTHLHEDKATCFKYGPRCRFLFYATIRLAMPPRPFPATLRTADEKASILAGITLRANSAANTLGLQLGSRLEIETWDPIKLARAGRENLVKKKGLLLTMVNGTPIPPRPSIL